MYFKRKIDSYLKEWKKINKILLIQGARQVGKSESIRQFGKNNFKCYFEFNVLENYALSKSLFKEIKDKNDFIMRLSSISKVNFIPNDTLIFIDEIQEIDFNNADIIMISKFLCDLPYKFIFSGSLLGITLSTVSWPVGYMIIKTMYPMDFEEFLWALNVNEEVINTVKESFLYLNKVDEFIHNIFIDKFYLYTLIGGMPEAIKSYIKSNDLKSVSLIHESILNLYKKDVIQYASKELKVNILSIYEAIPSQINSQNKRFILNKSRDNNKVDLYSSFYWLYEANVALPIYNVTDIEYPLMIKSKRNLLKCFLNDVGLLTSSFLDAEVKIKILNHEKSINYGAIFENVVAEELFSHGFNKLYYYNDKKLGEIDFLIEYKGEIIPLEIKSGKDYKRHNALNKLLNNKKVKYGYVFSNNNLFKKENIFYFPIYMISFLNS